MNNETVTPVSHVVGRVLLTILKYLLLVLFALAILLPILWVIVSAFKTTQEIQLDPFSLPKDLQWINFANAWTKAKMGSYFVNSLIITFGGLAILIVLAVPTAYTLARFRFPFSGAIAMLFLAGLFVNVNYIVTPLYIMVRSFGSLFGAASAFTNNLFTVMLIYAVTNLSFSIYLLIGYFKTMPRGYEEAAKIDGCGYFRTLVKICAPLAMPSIVTVILFNFLAFWNEFIVANTFLSTSQNTLPVGLLNIMRQSKFANDLGRMYAGLIIVMLPVLAVYCVVQGQLTKGMSLGGLKG